VAALDAACLRDGVLQPMPASFYAVVPPKDLALWAHQRGFYSLPTVELIDWLRAEIGGRTAVEIGCGHGAIGRALGIPFTDSKQQELPEMRALYAQMGQPAIVYPGDVEHLTAAQAAEKYRPEVVIGAWITHRYRQDRHPLGGNAHGVDEEALLDKPFVREYVMIGHQRPHELKPLLRRKHEALNYPFVFSRSNDGGNRIFVWSKSAPVGIR